MRPRTGRCLCESSGSWLAEAVLSSLATVCAIATAATAVAQEETPKGQVRLEPVLVSATRTGLSSAETAASSTVLTRDDVQSSSNVPLDDILRAIPGFSLYQRSSSMAISPDIDPEAQGVTLRNVGPPGASRALVMIDGIPAIEPYDGQVFWGKIPRDQIDRIEVVRGSGASLWGNYAMTGVINIITRKPMETGVTGRVDVGTRGLTDDSVLVSGRKDNLVLNLEGNFFNLDGYPIVPPSQRGPIDQNVTSQHDMFNGRATYLLNDTDSISLAGQFFHEDHNDGTPLRNSNTESGLIDVTGTIRTPDDSEWQGAIFSNMQTFNILFTEVNEARTSEVKRLNQQVPFTDVGGSLVWSKRIFDPLLLTAGSDLHWIDGKSTDQRYDEAGNDIMLTERSDGKQFFAGFFLQQVYTPTEQWEFALSNRVDLWDNYDGTLDDTPDEGAATHTSFASHSKAVLSPRLSILYRATDWLQVRGAAYRGFRAPTLAELYRDSMIEGLGILPNPNLSDERLNGAEMGVDFPLFPNFDLRATGFWNEIDNPVVTEDVDPDLCPSPEEEPAPGTAREEAVTCRKRFNEGLARTIGAEVDTRYEVVPHLTLYGSFLFADGTLVSAPQDPELEGKQLAQVPPYTFTLGSRYDNPDIVNLGVEGRFVDDQYEDAENLDRLGSYFLVNVSASKHLPESIGTLQLPEGEIFMAANNVFDRDYVVDLGGGITKLGTPLLVHGGVRVRF